ncbi:MAG: hypothetical protein P8100_16155, partial [bacterium]
LLLHFLVLFTLFNLDLAGQGKISLSGYVSDMQSVYRIPDYWLWENTLHNRLNLEFYPTDWLSGTLQMRNRAIAGNTIRKIPGYAESVGGDPGWLDMSWATDGNLGDSAAYVLTSAIDRLWLQFTFGNLEIKAGRQRINWGQTLVWNPNDIFNTYSYFEVDYPERPGSDAVRLSYYTGNASTLELAAKLDSGQQVTVAGYFRFNTLGFDIQFMGGMYQAEDLRFDYTFSSSLMIQLEGLYSGFAKEMDLNSFMQFYSGNLDVKNLGFTPWSFFGNVSYPLTPLLNGAFATIWYPDWKGVYLGPSFDFSLNDNMDLSLILQYFTAEF